MKTRLTRLLAVLMSVLMFAVPVLASAEAEGAYFVISDPQVSVGGSVLDFSGLTVELDAEEAEALMNFALRVLANGESALTAYVAAGEDGVKAYLEGMSNAYIVTAETIQQYMEQLAQSVPMAGGSISIDPENLFSEEAMEKYMGAVQEIAMQVISGEPAEDTFVTLAGDEVSASRIDFELTNEQLVAFMSATAELIESSPELSQQIASALEQQGVEGSLADVMTSSVQESGVGVNGSIYMSAESQDYRVAGNITAEEQSIPYTVEASMSEEGLMVVGNLHEPDDGTQEITFQVSVLPNEQLEGEMDVVATFGLYDTDDEGNTASLFEMTFVLSAEPAENDAVSRIFVLSFNAEETSLSLSASCTIGAESEEALLALSANQDGEDVVFSLTYNGAPFENETSRGHAGTISGVVTAEGQTVMANANVEFGEGLAESIAFDFSSVEVLDVMTIVDEEASEAISNDASLAVQKALGTLMNVPGVAALFSAMSAEG